MLAGILRRIVTGRDSYELTARQIWVLSSVIEEPYQSVSYHAERANIPRVVVTRAWKALMLVGMVTAQQGESDRRLIQISATRKGIAFAKKYGVMELGPALVCCLGADLSMRQLAIMAMIDAAPKPMTIKDIAESFMGKETPILKPVVSRSGTKLARLKYARKVPTADKRVIHLVPTRAGSDLLLSITKLLPKGSA